MKQNLTKPLTRGNQRVLKDFQTQLIELLKKQDFEHISVNQLCQLANYPRSTFYNYFDDKYDLLEFFLTELSKNLTAQNLPFVPDLPTLIEHFDKLYDLLLENENSVKKIVQHNRADGYLQAALRNYFWKISQQLMKESDVESSDLPLELVSEHCLSILLSVIDWIFLKHHFLDKMTAHQYLTALYGNKKYF
ncbi:TetR/AcrR family transcriptional regulator [Lactococcus nasutitermitis]|uniref:TetR/AcrR family transcriptional regulator n=1 Tax=Lactococcus nasutitermitis TaxID=1652957 RepID=A0ABV9JHY7_9LACT|nr:TetR family transcriptional regulator [Lactococcus nasutitermitis]